MRHPDNNTVPLSIANKNRGFRYERTQYESGDLEKAFADKWEKENEIYPRVNHGVSLLQLLFAEFRDSWISKWVVVIQPRDRYVVATVIQWLGSNCGFAFLSECLRKCGYEIIERERLDELYKEAHASRNAAIAAEAMRRENLEAIRHIRDTEL